MKKLLPLILFFVGFQVTAGTITYSFNASLERGLVALGHSDSDGKFTIAENALFGTPIGFGNTVPITGTVVVNTNNSNAGSGSGSATRADVATMTVNIGNQTVSASGVDVIIGNDHILHIGGSVRVFDTFELRWGQGGQFHDLTIAGGEIGPITETSFTLRMNGLSTAFDTNSLNELDDFYPDINFYDPGVTGFGHEIIISYLSQNSSGNQAGVSYVAKISDFTLSSVTPVPVPAAVWLFGSGFIGLVGMARRKNV